MKSLNDSAVMTLLEAAKLLGIHRSTAYELHRTGRFPVPVLKVGSQLKVSRDHMQLYLDGKWDNARPSSTTPDTEVPAGTGG